jgi:hypothetical protein
MPPGTNAYMQLYRGVSGWNPDLQTLLRIVSSASTLCQNADESADE